MRAWTRLALLGSSLALAGAAARDVRADEPTDLEEALAEPVVSTASKTPEDEATAPATVTSISAEDLRRNGIKSLDEALNYLSLGMMTSNPLHSVEVGSRGVLFTSDFGNHVLLLVNGHYMNEQWDGTAYFERGAGVPFELIDHIEISLGPGSVLYGSNAMLGVVNIVTKRAKDFEGGHAVFESDLLTSTRFALGAGHEFQLLGKPAELTLEIERYDQDGPAFNFAPENYGTDTVTGAPKKFNQQGSVAGTWGGVADQNYYTRIPDGYMRIIWGDWELDMRGETYQRATPYPNQFNVFFGDFNDPGSYELDRWLSADLKNRLPISSTITLRSRLYGDTYDYQQQVNTSAAMDCPSATMLSGCHQHVIGLSRWVGLEEQLYFDWLHDNTLTTLVGADPRYRFVGQKIDWTDAVTDENVTGTIGHYDKDEKAIGVYIQQVVQPFEWLRLNAGARYDADDRFGSKLSPRGTAAFPIWRGGTLKAIFAEAYRSPTAYETNYTDGVAQIPAPNLRPETVDSYEASFEQRVGTHRFLVGAFWQRWTDMVLYQPLTTDQLNAAVAAGQLPTGTTSGGQYQNVSSIHNFGFDAGYEGALLGRDFRYGVNFTAAYARRLEPDPNNPGGTVEVPLTVAPQWFGNAHISYDLPGDLPVLGAAALTTAKRPADRAFDGGFTPTPYAPTQVELRGTISGPFPGVHGLSYRFIADYAFAGNNPYVAGPVQHATAAQPNAQLSPIDQFRTTIGLQYDIR